MPTHYGINLDQLYVSFLFPVTYERLKIKNVIFNSPATVIFWEDGTKTVVKANNEPFDPEKGLVMGIVKRLFNNRGRYYEEIRKWLPDDYEKEVKA